MQANSAPKELAVVLSLADTIRGAYRSSEYGSVILPLLFLKRLDEKLDDRRNSKNEDGEGITNTSGYSLASILSASANPRDSLLEMVSGFEEDLRTVFRQLAFESHIARLAEVNLLKPLLTQLVDLKFAESDSPGPGLESSNLEYSEAISFLLERSNEVASEHSTPQDVTQLMVELLFFGDPVDSDAPDKTKTVFDPACGVGAAFSTIAEKVSKLDSAPDIKFFGQELNSESRAVCASRLLLHGYDVSGLATGNALAADAHPNLQADYLLCVPPWGASWSKFADAIEEEHEKKGHAGRFGAGLPRKSDSTLLFIQHMANKMRPPEQGGGRMAVLTTGSPLFHGAAGSGESEIRRWLIENDWLETIVALPPGLFYNTSILTYLWVMTNRKNPKRRGSVRLINGRDFCQSLHGSTGTKRRTLSQGGIAAISELLRTDPDNSNVLDLANEDFGYKELRIGRPLRLNFQVSEARLAQLERELERQSAKIEARNPKLRRKRKLELKQCQEEILPLLRKMDGSVVYDDREAFVKELKKAAKAQGISVPGSALKALLGPLSRRDQAAEICRKSGEPEMDPSFNLRLEIGIDQDAEEYLEREVWPQHPDAILRDARIGYRMKRVEHFGFELRRELEELRSEYEGCELKPLNEVCTEIHRRRPNAPATNSESEGLEQVPGLAWVKIETEESVLLDNYLAMFLSSELGQKLLRHLGESSTVGHIDPEDLGRLLVPVPKVAEQQELLNSRNKIHELEDLLRTVKTELAANPANISAVNDVLDPVVLSLGKLSAADQIRGIIRGGESGRAEFKETFSLDLRKQDEPNLKKAEYLETSALKTVVAFLNSEGGDLLVGVADNGEVPGLERETGRFHGGNSDKLLLHVRNRFQSRIGEQYYTLVDRKLVTVEGARVLWVHCEPSDSPVFLDGKLFYVRTNPATDELAGWKQYEYIKRRFMWGGEK